MSDASVEFETANDVQVTVDTDVVAGPYAAIGQKYKAGEELTDEEIDTLVDVALTILREFLGFFDAADARFWTIIP